MGAAMSWIEKLYRTYDHCAGQSQFTGHPLLPVSHTTQQAHIEIVLNDAGEFKSARALTKDEAETVIPTTEAAGGRSGSKPVNYPLCDKLQYVAGDFEKYGGALTIGFTKALTKNEDGFVHPHQAFLDSLKTWMASSLTHPKLHAVLKYVLAGQVVDDLIKAGILQVGSEGMLLGPWKPPSKDAKRPPVYESPIFKHLKDQREAFVRWRIGSGDETTTWNDVALREAWVTYYNAWKAETEEPLMCMVTGKLAPVATMHPAKLRSTGDKAKLISSNDTAGFTFRGRFMDPYKPKKAKKGTKVDTAMKRAITAADQACTISYEVSQKSHLALRWLLSYERRQAFRNGTQSYVAWESTGIEPPSPFVNSFELFDKGSAIAQEAAGYLGDAGQAFGIRLSKFMKGHAQKLGSSAGIAVLGIDSATGNKGRAAIIFYRELTSSEFLERIELWHVKLAWKQRYDLEKKVVEYIGAPAPNEIAEAAYGDLDKDSKRKLLRATIERLIPCIIDGRSLPRDLVEGAIRRTYNRTAFKKTKGKKGKVYENAWEMQLGIACSLYKGWNTKHTYQMGLEEDRTTRDYLYGRLLAIADFIENRALNVAGENRDTNAAKYMQRFAERPYSTWLHIEKSLVPYQQRLNAKRHGFLVNMKKELDAVHCLFVGDEYRKDIKLDGEFLLAFHCQRQRLWADEDARKKVREQKNNTDQTTN